MQRFLCWRKRPPGAIRAHPSAACAVSLVEPCEINKNPCKRASIPSSSLDVSIPQAEVEVNSAISIDRRSLVCRLAAHGAGDRNDVRKHLNCSRALPQPEDGCARQGKPDSHPACAAQARPEVRSPLDPLTAARPA